jgi:hypothetical protein
MKYYNVELTQAEAADLKQFLLAAGITFETSGCYDLVHFEIYASQKQAIMINSFLEGVFA